VADQVEPLILLAALSGLLQEEMARSGYKHLASDRFSADLRAFSDRVQDELDSAAKRRRLRLADEEALGVRHD